MLKKGRFDSDDFITPKTTVMQVHNKIYIDLELENCDAKFKNLIFSLKQHINILSCRHCRVRFQKDCVNKQDSAALV